VSRADPPAPPPQDALFRGEMDVQSSLVGRQHLQFRHTKKMFRNSVVGNQSSQLKALQGGERVGAVLTFRSSGV
jgi:hypothetical protein